MFYHILAPEGGHSLHVGNISFKKYQNAESFLSWPHLQTKSTNIVRVQQIYTRLINMNLSHTFIIDQSQNILQLKYITASNRQSMHF